MFELTIQELNSSRSQIASLKNLKGGVLSKSFRYIYKAKEITMPELSRFYGLIVFMNFKDHNPPHFHVWYGDFKAIVTINDGIVKGEMPQRALKMIFEWLEIHREELIADWNLAQKGDELFKIEPLK